ncbi:MAG: hypothetical protein Q8P18_26090 [Pseudomonadota bacterium]|nr:hypothetical protein [Pseudomonadota bacterium]
MPVLAHHLVFRLQDDRVFAPSPATRRRFAHIFARLGGDFPLLAWRVVDTHLHVLGLFDGAEVDEFARRLRIHLTTLHAGIPLLLSRRIPVQNQWHLAEAFGYVLRQDQHHGVGSDPLQEGSAVLDLLGMRVLRSPLAARVREHLPRVRREHLLEHLGVPLLEACLVPEHLYEATTAAFAVPTLEPRTVAVVTARAAAVQAAHAELGTAGVAGVLLLASRTVRRLASVDVAPEALRAVRLQMALRAARPALPEAFV